jgi:uncharacterized protein YecE (DUF72 family)
MIWVGTSGYNYPEWRGTFYPEKMPPAKMLPYYAERFPTVEINYTFYRMPSDKAVAGWASQTPSPYALTLKAPRRMTHDRRLRDCADPLETFCDVARTLGAKLGALLFQLPPNLKKDLARLESFLADMPADMRPAFEFRHESWFAEDVFSLLASKNVALCVADSERLSTPVRITAAHAYFRLRDEGYTTDDIRQWADRIAEATQACTDVFVYFKHEEQGRGPALAGVLMERLREGGSAGIRQVGPDGG